MVFLKRKTKIKVQTYVLYILFWQVSKLCTLHCRSQLISFWAMYQFIKECRLAIHCSAEPTNKKSQKFKNVYQNRPKCDLTSFLTFYVECPFQNQSEISKIQ